ncbi:MAG: ABC transporter permease [Acetobacteraceae bacterium]|nr:ABC transporter permease [Acetobacteraceae bacterium]
MRRDRLASIAWGLGTIAVLLLFVEWAVGAGLVKRALLPPPSSVGLVLWELVATGQVFAPLAETLLRLAQGFAAGAVVAIGIGLCMGYFPAMHDLLEPLVELVRPLPKSALIPVLILFLGLGETMKVTAVALAVFFPVLIATIQGVRGVDPVLLDAARTFGHRPPRILLHVILPAALPFVLAGSRIALGLGLVLVTLSEMLAGTGGVGFLILDMQRSFRVRQMYAWIVILALVGLVLNSLFVALERRLLGWQHAQAAATQ